MSDNTVITIDGNDFPTLEEFFDVVGRQLIGNEYNGRGGNLDWFNDILLWPYCPAPGQEGRRYTFVWRKADESRKRLGHSETVRQLEKCGLERFPNEFTSNAVSDIHAARQGNGPTVFDWLVEIIRDNQKYVDLRLE